MSTHAEEVKFTLKVMINKEKKKVLFAEADSDFVDVLLSFLTLPLGTIIRLLNKHYLDKDPPIIGSLTNLYKGLERLHEDYFWSGGGKQMLLHPRNSFEAECRKLKLNIDDSQPANYFRCRDWGCNRTRIPFVSMYHNAIKCDCGGFLNQPMGKIFGSITEAESDGDGSVFAQKNGSFLITDYLQVAPVVPGSIIETLINLGNININVTSGAELRTVNLGFNDIMDLLRGSLLSMTPLSDLLRKSCSNHGLVGVLQHQMDISSSGNESKKMIVKAWVKKSDSKFLFVQAEDDFVDFLFSLLVIPLSGIESLLGGNTLLKNIDNLYRSIANVVDDHKYLSTESKKSRLTKPELPPNYLSKNHMFPLSEQTNPTIYFNCITHSPDYTTEKGCWMRFKDPKGEQGSYVKRPGKFMVDANLTIADWDSKDSVLERRGIDLFDVNEIELNIGLDEALNILKASLTSSTALSDVLHNQILEKLRDRKHWVAGVLATLI